MTMATLSRTVLSAAFACAVAAAGGCAGSAQSGGKVRVIVCSDDPPTGSHIQRLRCYRKTQIDERMENDREQMRRFQRVQKPPPTYRQPGTGQ
jgi:hypothetical protein